MPAIVSGNGISLPGQPGPQEASLPKKQKLLFSRLQHQPQQLQQQPPLLPHFNSVQEELEERFDMPGGLLQQQQQQSSVEQPKQLQQVQTQSLSDIPTTNVGLDLASIKASVESSGQNGQLNVIDWQERIYQKPMAAEQLDKFKLYKTKVQRMIQYFQVSKGNIPPEFTEDEIDALDKQIQSVLNSFRKPALQEQQGHQPFLPQSCSHLHSMQQQSPSLMPQFQQQEEHSNQLQQMNLQASTTSMQPNIIVPIQHSSMPQLQQSAVQTILQNNRAAVQPGAALNSTHGSGVGVLQQTPFQEGSNNNINGLQQNSISSLQQTGNNPLQQNDLNPLQLNANTLQHHHQAMKPQEILHAQKFKNMQHQEIQMHQQQQQLQAAHMQLPQMPQFQQANDLNSESKPKLSSSSKKKSMQQQHTLSQHPDYQQQQQPFKTVSAFSLTSLQLLPAAFPQVSQQSSLQLDQQGPVASSLPVPKLGTLMQPVTLPFTAPSPSTLPSPSPMEDAEKQLSAIPDIGNSQGLKKLTSAQSHPKSLAIGPLGISASTLVANFSSCPAQNIINQDGHQNVSQGLHMEDKLSTKEPPFEHLIKVVSQDMGVNEAIFATVRMGNICDLFRQIIDTAQQPHLIVPETKDVRSQKHYRRLFFRSLTLLRAATAVTVLGFIAYVIFTRRANSS